MTTRVHALEDSSHLRPDGDCYAPQVVLIPQGYGRAEVHELNMEYSPVDGHEVLTAFRRLRELDGLRGDDFTIELMQRYYRIFYNTEMHHKVTRGFSQSDWGHSFVFATPEWLEVTGAYGVEEDDHNDFCAWLWGDVYEVFNDDPEQALNDESHPELSVYDEDCPMVVYGMDEAMKYGDITYPTHHSYVSYDYD